MKKWKENPKHLIELTHFLPLRDCIYLIFQCYTPEAFHTFPRDPNFPLESQDTGLIRDDSDGWVSLAIDSGLVLTGNHLQDVYYIKEIEVLSSFRQK